MPTLLPPWIMNGCTRSQGQARGVMCTDRLRQRLKQHEHSRFALTDCWSSHDYIPSNAINADPITTLFHNTAHSYFTKLPSPLQQEMFACSFQHNDTYYHYNTHSSRIHTQRHEHYVLVIRIPAEYYKVHSYIVKDIRSMFCIVKRVWVLSWTSSPICNGFYYIM